MLICIADSFRFKNTSDAIIGGGRVLDGLRNNIVFMNFVYQTCLLIYESCGDTVYGRVSKVGCQLPGD